MWRGGLLVESFILNLARHPHNKRLHQTLKKKKNKMSKAEDVVGGLPSNQRIEEGLETVKKEIHDARMVSGVDTTGHQILSDTERVRKPPLLPSFF